jgi:hypothetical protein
MPDEQRRYHSYLLRLWQANSEQAPIWRASLEDVQTGERHSFVDLARLFAFLEERRAPVRGSPIRRLSTKLHAKEEAMPIIRFRRLLFVSLAALLALAAISPTLAASRVERNTMQVDVTFLNEELSPVCGFPIQNHLTGIVNTSVHYDRDGNVIREISTAPTFQITFTNLNTGKSVISPGPSSVKVLYNLDGTVATFTVDGLNLRIAVPGHGLVFLQTGKLVFDADGNIIFASRAQQVSGDIQGFCIALGD